MKVYNAIVYFKNASVATYHKIDHPEKFLENVHIRDNYIKVFFYVRVNPRHQKQGDYCGHKIGTKPLKLWG